MGVTFSMPTWPEPVPPNYSNSNLATNFRQYIATGRESVACQKMLQVVDHLERIKPQTILDIGSWHLKQSLEFLHTIPGCVVHAFEPTSTSYELCQKTRLTLDEQMRNRVMVWPLALGDHDGIIDFFVIDPTRGDDNQGAASRFQFKPGMNGSFYGKNWVQKQVVAEMRTLDNWAQEKNVGPVDMLWIDVQGGELQVFQGARKTLESVQIIFTEVGLQEYYDGQSLKPDIDKFLADLGFVEITEAFELNGFEYEGNTVYVRR